MLADRGKAILISSHILTELAEICDGAVIIEQGRILRAGALKEIIDGESHERTILIRAAGGPEPLYREVLQLPLVLRGADRRRRGGNPDRRRRRGR